MLNGSEDPVAEPVENVPDAAAEEAPTEATEEVPAEPGAV